MDVFNLCDHHFGEQSDRGVSLGSNVLRIRHINISGLGASTLGILDAFFLSTSSVPFFPISLLHVFYNIHLGTSLLRGLSSFLSTFLSPGGCALVLFRPVALLYFPFAHFALPDLSPLVILLSSPSLPSKVGFSIHFLLYIFHLVIWRPWSVSFIFLIFTFSFSCSTGFIATSVPLPPQ